MAIARYFPGNYCGDRDAVRVCGQHPFTLIWLRCNATAGNLGNKKADMNAFKRAYYEATLKIVVWEKTANAYQDFFSDLMNKCYPGDFISSRTWGRMGDKKNDGYLQSTRTLFAVYAPDQGPAENTAAKMESDYTGGMAHWG